LPEPLVTDPALDPGQQAETADSLSLAFLVLLESLTPVERAVFLLRGVFDYGYDEIAGVVGKSEENCRQLAARARRHIETRKQRFEASRRRREELARRFFAAVEQGDTEGLLGLLAADVVAYCDGGGKALAVPYPVNGREAVARLLMSVRNRVVPVGIVAQPAEVNGHPGALLHDPQGRLVVVISLDVADGLVQTIRAVSNPDKLRHLGPVADPDVLLGARRAPTIVAPDS
jgi:RNA polymerase sigma-70 factor (ECF subfamily)